MIAAILAATYSITMFGLTTKVVEAQAVAEQWASDPVCQVLFPKGATGLDILRSQRYQDPQTLRWDLLCLLRDAAALVEVGSQDVIICPAFARESLRYRAATLIHESLHSAGVKEQDWPPSADTGLMTSRQLQDAVQLFCDSENRDTLIRLIEERKAKHGR